MKNFFKRGMLAVSMAGLAASPLMASAQESYPNKPIKVVVPYTPGGVSDTVTRLVMENVGKRLNTPVIVHNQPGANSMIGSAAVARSPADGYTFLAVVAAHAINPSLYSDMNYAPLKDLRGVGMFGRIPLIMVSSAQLPPTSLKEYVAWAKANPQGATYASSGIGSGAHLVSVLFGKEAGLELTHVPYKGIAPALPELFRGQVSFIFDSVQTMMPQIQTGKVHALAMTSSKRWPAAPDVPTMTELGYPEMTTGSWIGLLAPSNTPDAMVEQVSAALQSVVDDPVIHKRLISYGIDPVGGTPAQFDAFINSEFKRWAEVIRSGNIQLTD